MGIAVICKVSKPRCSVVELSFSFASKWYVLVVLKSAIVNCMIEKVQTFTTNNDILGLTLEKTTRGVATSDGLGFSGDTHNHRETIQSESVCQKVFYLQALFSV